MTHPRSAEFPGFTAAQIDAGLTTPVCEGANPFDWQAAMDETFVFDSLAVADTEHDVPAAPEPEPFWRSFAGIVLAFGSAFAAIVTAWAVFAPR